MYGEELKTEDFLEEGDAELMIGRSLKFLGELFENLTYTNSLVLNITHQLHNLYNKKQPKGHEIYSSMFKHVRLAPVFDALGSLLGGLALLDSVVTDNENLTSHWELYKRMMQFVKNNPSKYNISDKQERQLRKCLTYLDSSLLASNALAICLGQKSFDVTIATNKELQYEFLTYIRLKMEKVVNSLESQYENDEAFQVIDLLAVYALYRRLYPKDFDKKVFKAIWALQKKAPGVVVMGLVVFFPAQFISRHCPSPKSMTLEPKDPTAFMGIYLNRSDEQLTGMIRSWTQKYNNWSAKMTSLLMSPAETTDSKAAALAEARGNLLIQGVLLVRQIKNYILTNIALHLCSGTAFRQTNVPLLLNALELIKAIQNTFRQRASMQPMNLVYFNRVLAHKVARSLAGILDRTSRKKGESFDAVAAVQACHEILRGSINSSRLILLRLLTCIADMKGGMREDERNVLTETLWKLELSVDLDTWVHKATDCSFLYWARELHTPFLNYLYNDSANVHRLKYLYQALEDATELVRSSVHVESSADLHSLYVDDLLSELRNLLIMPLSRAIESDLRLQTHTVYIEGMMRQNPLQANNLSWYLEAEDFEFCGRIVSIKREVEDYIDETFYNMTALNLTDWRIYEEMRALAKQKYKLQLTDVHLPSKSLDQGLDLLSITKKLAGFVAQFRYNMHGHFFIEISAEDASHVQCVTYNHIGNSLTTHGIGVVATTINATYRLLAKKFQVFSQFLYDDHVLSPLMKDKKYYETNCQSLGQMFPYERAELFNREIRRLGVFDANQTYMDKFRHLIVHIGNMLGLIRTIKTAALSVSSASTQFMPDTQTITKLAELCENFSPDVKQATENLDKIVESMTKSYSEDTNYFELLVQTFKGVLNNSQATHLQYFYLIIPALSINYVESLLIAKDKLHKKKASGMYFTDDGFALGLAYVLRILDQEAPFDSLHWFGSVSSKFSNERMSMASREGSTEDLQKMQQISLKKIEVFEQEFETLSFCYSAAKLFFNDTK
mmetsp:Transcript_10644/g.20610  ORF Transcript_10644/g.20610 Transcript_10644/m.20610 type:complete len:1014 (+) Transcript_10644:358-3399(+)